MVDGRAQINEYDLGLPMPLEPLEARRQKVPRPVWDRLADAKRQVETVLGRRLVEMRLFGSYARGDFDEDSDVDVLVVARELGAADRRAVTDAVIAASAGEIVLSPLVLTSERLDELRMRERILAQDLDREGITL